MGMGIVHWRRARIYPGSRDLEIHQTLYGLVQSRQVGQSQERRIVELTPGIFYHGEDHHTTKLDKIETKFYFYDDDDHG